jgi:tetratricopeptide (TPR) repeat protein
MAVESGARASNTLTGELRSRPLAVLLAGACERGTSGTFTFVHGSRRDKLTMRRGTIAAVRSTEPVAYLGGILYELGYIDIATLNETLQEVAGAKRLHGDILVERGHLTRDRIDEGLVEQTLRYVHHLFSLPEATKWAFREDIDELAGARDEGRPAVETWQAIWRGLRDQPAAPHVARTLAKIDGGIHLRDLRAIDRFALAPEEIALCQRLHAQPSSLATLVATSGLANERTQLLVYLLALARCIVRVDTQPVGPLELGIEGVRLRAQRIDEEDPHTTLGLRAGASLEAARAAFFRLARLWHPDKIPTALADVRAECQHIFVRLGEAHRALTDLSARVNVESLVGAENAFAANDSVRPPAPARTLRDADAALARNDLAAADAIARSLTSAGADGPAARALLAWCALGAGTNNDREVLDRGLAALDKLLTGDPDCVRALFYRAQLLMRTGNSNAALRDYRKIIRIDPRHVDAQREVRLSEIRRRMSSSEMKATEPRRSPSREPRAQPMPPAPAPAGTPSKTSPPAVAAPPGPFIPTASGCASADDASVRSGLRRLLARVAGAK